MLAGLMLTKMACKHNISRKFNKSRTHIIFFIAVLIFLINRITNSSKSSQSSNPLKSKLQTQNEHKQLENLLIAVSLERRKVLMRKPKNFQNTVILLLILLSNDVQINPGPVQTIPPDQPNCSLCKKPVNQEVSLQCSTCNMWCHIKCAEGSKPHITENLRNQCFQWICSSENCNPNLNQAYHVQSSILSPNKYNFLSKVISERKKKPQDSLPKSPKRRNEKNISPGSSHNNLLKELPKISSKHYIGKDLCRSCVKEVKECQQAIFCDTCDRWIHRSCSDMSLRIYKQFTKKKKFTWTCNKCRKDDELHTDKADTSKLSEDEKPEKWENIQKTRKELLIVHMNCRSVANKEEELEDIIIKLDPDIIPITETWLDDSAPKQTSVPAGYKIIRKDRSESFKQKYGRNRGGGVAILYKENLKVEMNKYTTDPTEEILWCQVKCKDSFMLGVVYRAEYTDILQEDGEECKLEENIRKVTELSSKVIVTGDFNIDISDDAHKNTQSLKLIYGAHGLKQHINKPTRIDKQTSKPTIIDHVWATEDSNLIKATGTFVALSDHLGQYIKLNQSKSPEEKFKIKFRDYRNYNESDFNSELQTNIVNSEIEQHLQINDVNTATETLIKVIQETADVHAPLVEKTLSNKKRGIPWFTQELKELIQTKNELIQDMYNHGCQSYNKRIKSISNTITQMKRNLKHKYLSEKLDEAQNDTKKCWDVLNMATNRTKVKESIEPENITQEKANQHNKYFASIGIEIQKKLGIQRIETPSTENEENQAPKFEFSAENPEAIEKLIDNIRIDVATGEDNIGARLIKDMKHTISPILTRIINIGYECNTFPDCMKKASIKVIHKKDSTEDISNYRPISILPTISKIFERAAVNQIVNYLETNNLLSNCQHAYRKHHSTITCLFELVNYVYSMIDNKRLTAIASLDLSKAFDSISHELMLEKLYKLGLGRNTTSWISSYLTNRKQVIKFRHFTSGEEIILSGVPQGSILGPLLFLCFTNDLFNEFQEDCKIIAYADDTQIVVTARKMEHLKRKVEEVITAAQRWYKNNSMKNNIGKTEVLVFNTNQNITINVVDDGKPVKIKSKGHIKVLGVILDSNLNWSHQVNAVKKKAFNVTRNIHRINHLLNLKNRLKLYHAIISPQFSYGDIIWGGCRQIDSKRLQSVQNFAAKSITGHRKFDSATDSMQQLKLLNLEQRRIVHENVFAHKALLQQKPDNINNQLTNQLSTSNTRQATQKKLNLPQHKTSKFQRSPLYRTITSWNTYPNFSFGNINQHKSLLQNHLQTSNATM